jgi:hypothetical protein
VRDHKDVIKGDWPVAFRTLQSIFAPQLAFHPVFLNGGATRYSLGGLVEVDRLLPDVAGRLIELAKRGFGFGKSVLLVLTNNRVSALLAVPFSRVERVIPWEGAGRNSELGKV